MREAVYMQYLIELPPKVHEQSPLINLTLQMRTQRLKELFILKVAKDHTSSKDL